MHAQIFDHSCRRPKPIAVPTTNVAAHLVSVANVDAGSYLEQTSPIGTTQKTVTACGDRSE